MTHESYRPILESIARTKSSQLEVFSDFCRISACAVSLFDREPEYLAVAGRYNRDELADFSQAFANLVNEMEEKPFTDILGDYYLEPVPDAANPCRTWLSR